jgi:transposase InsO family protein
MVVMPRRKDQAGARKQPHIWVPEGMMGVQREGTPVARCTVGRLMAGEGMHGAVRGKRRRTTIPDGQAERTPDLVDRDLNARAPNRLWVEDFAYVPAWSGVVYVAFAIDAFSRRIVGWKADTTMKRAWCSTGWRRRSRPATTTACPSRMASASHRRRRPRRIQVVATCRA